MGDLVLRTEVDGVRTLTLNRPERRNALSPAMQDQLIAELERASETRILILTGVGDAFCAGLDLAALQQTRTAAEHDADSQRIAHLFRTLYELPVPTIAAVNGHAIAGGTGLATLCDFTFAVPAAKFGYPEVKIGFLPALVSAYLTLQVGEKRARDLLLTGRLFSAAEAFRLGLVTEVIDGNLSQRVAELAAQLKGNSPASLRATKQLLADTNRAWLDAALAHAIAAGSAIRNTPDFREGLAAFLEKRPPRWTT